MSALTRWTAGTSTYRTLQGVPAVQVVEAIGSVMKMLARAEGAAMAATARVNKAEECIFKKVGDM